MRVNRFLLNISFIQLLYFVAFDDIQSEVDEKETKRNGNQ